MPQPFHVAGASTLPLLGGNMALMRNLFTHAFPTIDPKQAKNALTIFNLFNFALPGFIQILYSLRHYTRVFFTSAVTIRLGDELYPQVIHWLAERQSQSRFVTEYTAQTMHDDRLGPLSPRRKPPRRTRYSAWSKAEVKKPPSNIRLVPAFKSTWFFYRWNLLAILRSDKSSQASFLPVPGMFGPPGATRDRDSLTITCLGWSTGPIRELLETCREMAEAQRKKSVTIWGCVHSNWDVMAVKHLRPLETITIDEDVKENLVSDIRKYLNPRRRQFYNENGIPYRRGYLLHGPPGCGKSSLSLALAGYFGVDLYIMNLAEIEDFELASLFATLPDRCFVLLEDIDAVGFRTKQDGNIKGPRDQPLSNRKCSFSTLLNVLDGVASQEGRVVIMTSNFPERLDDALVRPGRIDVKICMGPITRQGAHKIFLRMMKTGRLDNIDAADCSDNNSDATENGEIMTPEFSSSDDSDETAEDETDEELQLLAQKFANCIPDKVFTPAQLQGYLLKYLHSAATAVEMIADWVVDEQLKMNQEALQKEEEERKKAENPREKSESEAAK
ncbi:P-loop containing nucleoside triphosphate hydrolase protein [Xylaria arbuscula]|nr:P-loop containing nucleoside triphosphate hydrolase protein [Xylaria arbuscula]